MFILSKICLYLYNNRNEIRKTKFGKNKFFDFFFSLWGKKWGENLLTQNLILQCAWVNKCEQPLIYENQVKTSVDRGLNGKSPAFLQGS